MAFDSFVLNNPELEGDNLDQALDQNPCLVDEGCDLDSVHEYAKGA